MATRFLGRDVTQGLVGAIVLQVVGAVVSFAMFLLAARTLSFIDFGHLSKVYDAAHPRAKKRSGTPSR